MILVTVGSSNFKFDRIFKIIDELCDEHILNAKDIIAQTGKIDYKIRNYENFEFDSNQRMSFLQDEADLIICHSGTGSVLNCLKKHKKIIVFPRLAKYKEHTDNHQLDLCNSFFEEGFILKAENKEELIDALNKVCTFTPIEYKSNTNSFVELLISLIEGANNE